MNSVLIFFFLYKFPQALDRKETTKSIVMLVFLFYVSEHNKKIGLTSYVLQWWEAEAYAVVLWNLRTLCKPSHYGVFTELKKKCLASANRVFSCQILVSVFYIYWFIYANALQLYSSPYCRICVSTRCYTVLDIILIFLMRIVVDVLIFSYFRTTCLSLYLPHILGYFSKTFSWVHPLRWTFTNQ